MRHSHKQHAEHGASADATGFAAGAAELSDVRRAVPRTKGEALPSLFRYFMAASVMRQYFDKSLASKPSALSSRDAFLFLSSQAGIFMTYWYGGLYVVIEGWQELGLRDPEIDDLLKSANVALLERFRNGAFHFQKSWLDSRVTNFMASPDSVSWVRKLTAAFRRSLMATMNAKYGKARA